MNAPDLIILFILLGFALSGVRRGLVWETFTAIGLVLGFWLTFTFRQDFMRLIARYTDGGWERQWVVGLCFLAAFLLVYLGFAAIGHKLHDKIDKTTFKWPDRVLGVIAGIAKGILLIAMIVIASDMLDRDGRVRDFIDQSRLIRWGRHIAHDVTHWEPRDRQGWV
jgi:membrane protein required for colicin V production